jgi:hypothetical protein
MAKRRKGDRKEQRRRLILDQLRPLSTEALQAVAEERFYDVPTNLLAHRELRRSVAIEVLRGRRARVISFLKVHRPKTSEQLRAAMANVPEEWFRRDALAAFCRMPAQGKPEKAKKFKRPKADRATQMRQDAAYVKNVRRQKELTPLPDEGGIEDLASRPPWI